MPSLSVHNDLLNQYILSMLILGIWALPGNWNFAENLGNHHRFVNMLRVLTSLVFQTILTLIEEHPVFANNSNNAQTPVEQQLAGRVMYDGTIVVLYEKPGLNGDAYCTRKGNYGLNAQVSCLLTHL
ncbi:hypothetical protein BYT27DRAFT_7222041 [Phlegmacium glaucopus]|nr:hypothetical protein BYT27DRAFT_7222041 [Phlegmacium glaucopus]